MTILTVTATHDMTGPKRFPRVSVSSATVAVRDEQLPHGAVVGGVVEEEVVEETDVGAAEVVADSVVEALELVVVEGELVKGVVVTVVVAAVVVVVVVAVAGLHVISTVQFAEFPDGSRAVAVTCVVCPGTDPQGTKFGETLTCTPHASCAVCTT